MKFYEKTIRTAYLYEVRFFLICFSQRLNYCPQTLPGVTQKPTKKVTAGVARRQHKGLESLYIGSWVISGTLRSPELLEQPPKPRENKNVII